MSTERIRELLDLMQDHELVEMELEEKDLKIRLCKAQPQLVQAVAAPAALPVAAATPEAAAPAEKVQDPSLIEVKSPIVGTFYSAPSPDADAFVQIGSTVTKDSVVGIIEAMKVMNEVKAEANGTVAEILVQNGEPVEYGQPIFLLKP